MTQKWMDVTPETAKRWLETRNRRNRPMVRTAWSAYAKDMCEGLWQETCTPIMFDKDGVLMDGQHRLRAIVESGCTIRILVVEGADPDNRFVIDTGVRRSAADSLVIAGTDRDVHFVRTATSLARCWQSSGRWAIRGSHVRIKAICEAFENEIGVVESMCSPHIPKVTKRAGVRAGFASALIAIGDPVLPIIQVLLDALRLDRLGKEMGSADITAAALRSHFCNHKASGGDAQLVDFVAIQKAVIREKQGLPFKLFRERDCREPAIPAPDSFCVLVERAVRRECAPRAVSA